MTTETYIPYSIRNNIADPELAGLLDYLEREMGWDIECDCKFGKKKMEGRYIIGKFIFHIWGKYVRISSNKGFNFDIDRKIFFRTYKTLLPVIRDLYSK